MTKPVLAVAALLALAACGGGEEPAPAAGAASPAARDATPATTGCRGTLTGPQPGAFTCMAVANQDADPERSAAGKSSIVTVLSNPYDPSHKRPEGVKSIGFNFELKGEPTMGTFSIDDAGAATTGAVVYDEGPQFDKIRSLTLDLTQAAFESEQSGFGMTSRVYKINGTLKATLADPEGRELVVEAEF